MKKLLLVVSLLLLVGTAGCQNEKETLYLLNWGEYINEEVVEAFENEYNVNVVMDVTDSNESMYERIKSGNTAYDVAVPSDYMIEKLMNEGLLNELDFDLFNNNPEVFDIVTETLEASTIETYASPYFFGSIGIMYNLEYKELVEEHGFAVFFEEVLPREAKIGMYNSSRDAIACALLYLGYDVNTTDETELAEAEAALSKMDYTIWGDDNLKKEIGAGNLDVALTYSGDFFDEFYVLLEEESEQTFDFYSPMENNLWVDALVIPTTSENVDLAHQFIDFFRNADNALWNVEYVGYASPIMSVYDEMLADGEWDDITMHPAYLETFISPDFKGQVYRDLGSELYEEYEAILNRAKSK